MKKAPMIALKSVKTLPATMLEAEREECLGGRAQLAQPLCRRGAGEAPLDRRVSHWRLFNRVRLGWL